MAEIALLEPRVLNGVIQEFEGPEELLGRALLGTPDREINPVWEYDINLESRGAQTTYSVPNSEARIVDKMRKSHIQGGFAYIRDKKTFEPTTLRWLRRVGELAVARGNAERMVMEEMEDLRMQHYRGEEIAIWKMFQGEWQYSLTTGAVITVDYQIPDTHKPAALTGNARWGQTADDPIGNIQSWKRVISRDSGFPLRYAYMSGKSMDRFNRLPEVKAELSDRQKDNYTREGIVPRFFGIDWIEYDGGYVDDAGVFQPYLPDNKIVMIAPGGSRPWNMLYGPSADTKAPPGHTGPFAKTWDEEDPSGRQFLMENNYMPQLRKPRQLLVADMGSA